MHNYMVSSIQLFAFSIVSLPALCDQHDAQVENHCKIQYTFNQSVLFLPFLTFRTPNTMTLEQSSPLH